VVKDDAQEDLLVRRRAGRVQGRVGHGGDHGAGAQAQPLYRGGCEVVQGLAGGERAGGRLGSGVGRAHVQHLFGNPTGMAAWARR
jgi:hypothetical protein